MMEKEKKKIGRDKIVLLVCAIFFGIVSIIIWHIPVLKFHRTQGVVGAYLEDIAGFQLAFGGTTYRYVIGPFPPTAYQLNPCPVATVTVLLIMIGFVTSIASFILTLKDSQSQILKILVIMSAATYFIGGIMCFFLEQSFAISNQSKDLLYYKDKMLSDYNVCPFYAIMGITCAFLTSLQTIYFKKKH